VVTSTRTSFTLDRDLAEAARRLRVNVSAAARKGVEDAVRSAMAEADREAYRRRPERPDPFWSEVEGWTDDDAR
jgi:post-segregation antitoxin (ccd killing protein)